MIAFGCSSSCNLLLERMPYRLLEFDYTLLNFFCVWDELIESEGIDGNLWVYIQGGLNSTIREFDIEI